MVTRHKTKYRSEAIAWEPSFKCTSSGSIVWPQPFECIIPITPPTMKDASTGRLRHKDITISLQNVDKKTIQNTSKPTQKHKKTLAKVRLNLTDYYDSHNPKSDSIQDDVDVASSKQHSIKLKLRPESSKVVNASINITIQRRNFNELPLASQDSKYASPEDNSIASPDHSSQPIAAKPKQDDDSSDDTASHNSESLSITESPYKLPSPQIISTPSSSPEKIQLNNTKGIFSRTSTNAPEEDNKFIPILPPPLPPREWQKANAVNNSMHHDRSSCTTNINPPKELSLSKDNLLDLDPSNNIEIFPEERCQDPVEGSRGVYLDGQEAILNVSLHSTQSKNEEIPYESSKSINCNELGDSLQEQQAQQKNNCVGVINTNPEVPNTDIVSGNENHATPEKVKDALKILPNYPVEIEDSNSGEPSDKSIFTTPEKPTAFRIKVPPSPIMKLHQPNTQEKQLIDWANKALSKTDPPIKITNLYTSWQNGLGFCALIRKYFPTIMPPLNQLKADQRIQNCQLAIQAAGLIGIETSLIVSEDSKDEMILCKSSIKILLKELKEVFQTTLISDLCNDEINKFQCRWYRNAGFFADNENVLDMIKKEKHDQLKEQESARLAEEAEKQRTQQEKLDKLYEGAEKAGLDVSSRGKNKSKVQEIINEAHTTSNSSDDVGQNVIVGDVPDIDDSTSDPKMVLPDQEQISPNSTPTTPTSNTDCSASCEDDQSNSSICQGHMFKNTTYLIFQRNPNSLYINIDHIRIQDYQFFMVNKSYF